MVVNCAEDGRESKHEQKRMVARPPVLTSAMFDTIISSMRVFAAATSLTLVILGVAPAAQDAPNPDNLYRLGPDSLEQEGVPKGDIRGPFTLPSAAYPGTQHTYWVYVPGAVHARRTREPDGVQRRAGVQESERATSAPTTCSTT